MIVAIWLVIVVMTLSSGKRITHGIRNRLGNGQRRVLGRSHGDLELNRTGFPCALQIRARGS